MFAAVPSTMEEVRIPALALLFTCVVIPAASAYPDVHALVLGPELLRRGRQRDDAAQLGAEDGAQLVTAFRSRRRGSCGGRLTQVGQVGRR